ncbi:hypothetical protein BD410DRAFT_852621 [Rickenella mellea]|uniref:Uncharacterized protein n=1 Tax=Rickenella mellea TaxID=50990 RepID=A0A4Y7PKJ6_9AGAM|nr:hypothetical protein BD410DRAFT_852621 [Rickenella mellea]
MATGLAHLFVSGHCAATFKSFDVSAKLVTEGLCPLRNPRPVKVVEVPNAKSRFQKQVDLLEAIIDSISTSHATSQSGTAVALTRPNAMQISTEGFNMWPAHDSGAFTFHMQLPPSPPPQKPWSLPISDIDSEPIPFDSPRRQIDHTLSSPLSPARRVISRPKSFASGAAPKITENIRNVSWKQPPSPPPLTVHPSEVFPTAPSPVRTTQISSTSPDAYELLSLLFGVTVSKVEDLSTAPPKSFLQLPELGRSSSSSISSFTMTDESIGETSAAASASKPKVAKKSKDFVTKAKSSFKGLFFPHRPAAMSVETCDMV